MPDHEKIMIKSGKNLLDISKMREATQIRVFKWLLLKLTGRP